MEKGFLISRLITMSEKEFTRLEIIQKVIEKRIYQREAAEIHNPLKA